MPVHMDFNWTNDELTPLVERAIRNGKNLSEPLEAIGELMVGSVQETFDWEGRPDPWEPLESSTLYGRFKGSKTKKKGGFRKGFLRKVAKSKILTDTARLRNSVDWEEDGNSVAWGSNVIYAATHNFGDEERSIPERQFIQEPFDEDMKDITEILFQFVFEAA